VPAAALAEAFSSLVAVAPSIRQRERHAVMETHASIGILPRDSEQAVGEAEVQRCRHDQQPSPLAAVA
jgi:hypothetical protein